MNRDLLISLILTASLLLAINYFLVYQNHFIYTTEKFIAVPKLALPFILLMAIALGIF